MQAEILVLRHQLNILHRRSPKRVALGKIDRLVFCGLYRLSPTVLDALKIHQPETVIRWHRAGFRAYWRRRSRRRGGRPGIPADIRHLILEMSLANPLWGAPRIHGELLKLGVNDGLLVLQHSRRELLWLGVTAHPSAEWIVRQLTEACGWSEPPRYIIRDRDREYGEAFIRRLTAMGIRDRPISA